MLLHLLTAFALVSTFASSESQQHGSQTQFDLAQCDPIKDFVTAKQSAYLMMPPDLVCGPKQIDMRWSPDGQRLAVLRQYQHISAEQIADSFVSKEPLTLDEAETQVITWNVKTQKATTAFRLRVSNGVIDSMDWITGSSSMVLEVRSPNPDDQSGSQVVLLQNSGTAKVIVTQKVDEGIQILPSPVKPIVAYVEYPFVRRTSGLPPPVQPLPSVRFFGVDGVLSGPISFGKGNSRLVWSANGTPYIFESKYDRVTNTMNHSWSFVDRTTNSIKPSNPPSDLVYLAQNSPPPQISSALDVQNVIPKLRLEQKGFDAPVVTIRANKIDESFGLVTSDGMKGEIAPHLTAVSYVSQGNVMVRTLAKVPLDAYLVAKNAAIRTKLLNQAKQVGIALVLNAGDNSDNYLSNKGDWKSILIPYLKDASLMDGFNYVFPGGDAAKISDPSGTVLGYLEGPGGRAVVYTDSHAKWVPNP